MSNIGRIRNFLLRHPKPSSVRVSSEDTEPQVLKPKSYAKAAETIAALDPELLECLDKDGGLLRAMRLDGTVQNPSEDEPLPQVLSADPQAAAFALYARLIAKAYEHSTDVAFTKMVELCDRMNERSDSIEQRLERTEAANRRAEQQRHELELEYAEEKLEETAAAGGADVQTQMAQAFMASAMSGTPPPATPATKPGVRSAPNGKGHD